MKKRIAIVLFLLFISMFMSGCMLPIFGNKPTIESSPDETATAGKLYTYQIELNDDASSKVVFSLILAPDGMTIDSSTGLIMWTPTESQLGENEVKIRVSDGWHRITQEFIVEVSIIKLSSIIVEPETMSIITGSTQSISSVTAYYDDGSSATIAKADCSYQSDKTNIASVNVYGQISGKTAGDATIFVSYTEDEITKSDTISVIVSSPAPPPSGGG